MARGGFLPGAASSDASEESGDGFAAGHAVDSSAAPQNDVERWPVRRQEPVVRVVVN